MCSNPGAGRSSNRGSQSASLNIGRKGAPREVDVAMAITNPHFLDADATANGWRQNCQSCAITQEALIRGYYVEAVPHAPNTPYFPDTNGIEHFWTDALSGGDKDFYTRDNRRWIGKETSNLFFTERQVQREVESWGDGARGVVSVKWKGYRSSHILNVINGGSQGVYFSDGQSGRKYTLGDILSRASSKTGFLVTRVDTLDFTENAKYLMKGK